MTACWLQPFAYQPTHLHLLHYRQHPPNLPLTSALLISPTARAHCLWTHFTQLQTDCDGKSCKDSDIHRIFLSFLFFFCVFVCVSSNFIKCGSLFGCFLPEDSIAWCRQIWGHAILKSCAADLNSEGAHCYCKLDAPTTLNTGENEESKVTGLFIMTRRNDCACFACVSARKLIMDQ